MFRSRRCRLPSAQCGRVVSALAGPYSLETHPETAGPAGQHSGTGKPRVRALLENSEHLGSELMMNFRNQKHNSKETGGENGSERSCNTSGWREQYFQPEPAVNLHAV